jgi:hypothetical protein
MKLSECQKTKVIISKSLYKGANEYKCDNNLCSVIDEDKDEFIFNGCKLRMSAHVLRYKAGREVSHTVLQQNRTKRRYD